MRSPARSRIQSRPWSKWFVPALLVVFAILGASFMFRQPNALIGTVVVVDGDTVKIKSVRVRLVGIDAPEHDQVCRNTKGAWHCGMAATVALRKYVNGKEVVCIPTGHDRYRRILAHCKAQGADVGEWLVANGWALAYLRYSNEYASAEDAAQLAQRGIWSSNFVAPESWRRTH